ncbi:anhydro-N-acetylmuramic acid kinase [Maricurvus nonylphenolicus]|uniref:anhydro-N-acetylmuramic acid kinase n=1 Tax=Maricurvus nonylphenolicus TaxID=1008307 RepID=UPI0036F3C43D
MTNRPELYIGLMSGTSADGIDAALVDYSQDTPTLVAKLEYPLGSQLKNQILQLCSPGDNEIERMGQLDRLLGQRFAEATLQLLENSPFGAEDIAAVGSHGQTIRHRPPGQLTTDESLPFTLQIGDPNTIAELTGITTVADFRRRDVAAKGQGAPLAPAFHQALFTGSTKERFIVNIGGMSNITQLTPTKPALGFDTGPGNVLMDGWIYQQRGEHYDRDGHWAASGQANLVLLDKLLAHPFLQLPAPKSTGREAFNLAWLEHLLSQFNEPVAAADVQATLLEFTARTISDAIGQASSDHQGEIYICGGGAHNAQLMHRLSQLNQGSQVNSTETIGIAPEWVEAMAFAWLAQRTLQRQAGNLKEVTGANGARILGGIYYP